MSNYPPQPGYPQQQGYPGPQGYHPPQGYPPPGGPWPPQRAGMGCGTKLLIALGGLFLLMLLMCCGGGFFLYSYFRQSIIDDPTQISDVTKEITTIDVPEPLAPTFGADFRVPFSSQLLALATVYTDPQKDSTLVLISVGNTFGEDVRQQLKEGLEKSVEEQRGKGQKKDQEEERLEDVKKTERQREIRGEKAVFNITEGVGAKSRKKRIRVQGSFKGELGPVMLLLDADAERLPMEKVVQMLDSIK